MKFIIKVWIGVASAGAVGAAGVATGVIPNPFVTEHEAAARHRTHEMKVRWHHDGKQETIPIIEQGIPFDDAKYFDLKSPITANPLVPESVFLFDHEIEQFVKADGHAGTLRYKVNSNDNSMYWHGTDVIDNPLFATLKNNAHLAKYTLDFIVRNAQNDWLLFVSHATEGRWAIQVPSGSTFSDVFTDTYLSNLEFLQSVKSTSTTLVTDSPLEPYSGQFTDANGRKKNLTLWFAKEEAQIATGVPIMGLGVGIFKNTLEKRQRYLAITEYEGYVFKLVDLQTIEPWGINTQGYRTLTFHWHLPSGQNRAADITAWLMSKQNEMAELRAQMKACPAHQAGKQCREQYRKQIKAIQDEMEQKAKELSNTWLPPMK